MSDFLNLYCIHFPGLDVINICSFLISNYSNNVRALRITYTCRLYSMIHVYRHKSCQLSVIIRLNHSTRTDSIDILNLINSNRHTCQNSYFSQPCYMYSFFGTHLNFVIRMCHISCCFLYVTYEYLF